MPKVDLEKIKRLRLEKGLTQKKMADYLGYESDVSYMRLEKGARQIRADQIALIAEVLGVPLEDLFIEGGNDQ